MANPWMAHGKIHARASDNIFVDKPLPLGPIEHVQVQSVSSVESPKTLRSYDKGLTTRKVCLIGLGCSWLVSLGCIIAVIVLYQQPGKESASAPRLTGEAVTSNKSAAYETIVPLIFTFFITLCNECVGLIHTTTLRWALFHEGQLKYNTNLRLFTRTKSSRANDWLSNLAYAIFMTLSYATAARIFQDSYIRDPVMSYDKKQSYVNLVALSVLSIALIGQTSIATWAYMTTKPRIVTWSSNSLNNALIYKRLSYSGDKSHMGPQDGRSSRVVGTWLALNPEKKQRGLWRARSASIKIVIYIWILAGAALLWAFIAQFVSEASGTDVSVTIAQSKNNGHRTTYIINGDKHVSGNRFHFFVILLVFLVQIPFTLGLHCVELVVNCTRDEKAWRRATTKKGARIDSNAIVGACKSWDTVTLFVLKGAIHWAFGEAGSSAALPAVAGLYLQYLSLFILAFFLGYLAIFTTILTFRKPKGPQPAAWGHLRSLTELIDDWGKDEDPIFWGDKGSSESSRSVRYAGTAAKREIIGPIQMDARYEMGEAISGDAQTKPMSC